MNKSILYSIFIISIFICTLYLNKKLNTPVLNTPVLKTPVLNTPVLKTLKTLNNIEKFGDPTTPTPNPKKIIYHNVWPDDGGISESRDGSSHNAVSKMNKLTKNSIIFFKPMISKEGEYTISFFLKINNVGTVKTVKTIISCKKTDVDDTPIWSLRYNEDTFYIKLGNSPDKNSESFNLQSSIDDTKIYSVYISFRKDELFCWIDGESKKLKNKHDTTSSTLEPDINNIILFNSDSLILLPKDIQDDGTSLDSMDSISVSNIFVHKDFFTEQNINYTPTCKYNPSNDTNMTTCKEKCNNEQNCKQEDCNKICKTLEKQLHEPSLTSPEPDCPKKIRVVSKDRGFIVEFKKPEYQGFKAKIDKFIIIVKPLYIDIGDSSNNTRIYTFNATNSVNCKYEIDGLINKKFYNISVLSHSIDLNKKEFISINSSDVETEAPDGLIMESHPALIENETEIKNIVENEDTIQYNSPCYGDESSKYKFSSSLLDIDKVKNMYKPGGTSLENMILTKIDPNIENLIYDMENINKKGIESYDSDSVSIMKDFDSDFNFI